MFLSVDAFFYPSQPICLLTFLPLDDPVGLVLPDLPEASLAHQGDEAKLVAGELPIGVGGGGCRGELLGKKCFFSETGSKMGLTPTARELVGHGVSSRSV